MIHCVRVRTGATMGRPEIHAFVVSAVAEVLRRIPPEECYKEITRRIGENTLGVFIGFSDQSPEAMAIAELPTSAFQLAPVVVLAYAIGERDVTVAVGARLREWVTKAGYSHVDALNLRHTDRSFQRGFGHFGVPARIGSVMRLSW